MDFPRLVQALQDPRIYPEKPRKIDVEQTHISAIFLTGVHAYKVKKPVNFGFLDFTTLEKRKFYCQQEVDLNRRLSPEIYLGVVAIRSRGGRLSLGEGPGKIVEYAVQMKQLPPGCTMDRRLAQGEVGPEVLEKVARKIADFHSRAATGPEISSFGEIGTIRGNIEENFQQTEKYIGRALSAEAFREIEENNRIFMDRQLPLFQKRISGGKIRDCHGDLHLQHICLSDGILVFDCIEFNDRFRYSDVAADIAFLLMDLDDHGAPHLSADLASRYLKISRDWPIYLLLNFYKCYRAYVRGKVTCFRLEDPGISGPEKAAALEDARRYFVLSGFYARRLNRPALLVTGGLMGTGKSTLARLLSEILDWSWLRSDVIRKELARISPREHRYEEFQKGIYSADFSRRTYGELLERAGEDLNRGRSVIVDGAFMKQSDRDEARALAESRGAEFLLIECRCPEEEIERRLGRRLARGEGEPSDGRWEIFHDQKRNYEPVGFPPELFLPLNTEASPEECLDMIFQHLLRRAGEELRDL